MAHLFGTDGLPDDWEQQVDRAYSVFAVDPLDGADEFGLFSRFPKLSPEFLREKAKKQLRDVQGKFRDMRARLQGEDEERVVHIAPTRRVRSPQPPTAAKGSFTPQEQAAADLLWPSPKDPVPSHPASPDLPRGSKFPDLGYSTGHLDANPSPEAAKAREELIKSVAAEYQKYLDDHQGGGPPLTMEEYIQRSADAIRDHLLAKGDYHLRRKLGRFDAVLLGGNKNQFETNTSGGFLDNNLRRDFEEATLGVPRDQPAHLRPVYGYLGDDPNDQEGVGQYGDLILTPKESVDSRVTITPGDSLDTRTVGTVRLDEVRAGTAAPGDLIAAAGKKFVPKMMTDTAVSGRMAHHAMVEPIPFDLPSPYSEAQIHGGLPASDIAKITFDSQSSKEFALYEGRYTGTIFDDLGLADERGPEAAYRAALHNMGLSMDDFGESGSDLREQADQAMADTIAMYEKGEINSIAESPAFQAMLQQYVKAQGLDAELEFRVDPPLSGEAAADNLWRRTLAANEAKVQEVMQQISRRDYLLNNGYPIPDDLAAALETSKAKKIIAEIEKKKEERRKWEAENPAPVFI